MIQSAVRASAKPGLCRRCCARYCSNIPARLRRLTGGVNWQIREAPPQTTPNTLASRTIFPDWNCAILWFPVSAGGLSRAHTRIGSRRLGCNSDHQKEKHPTTRNAQVHFRHMEREPDRLVIRCGSPDCEWGFPMPDLGEATFKACYSSFRKHCVAVHRLRDDDLADSEVFLDLGKWTLTLLT